MRHGFSNKRGGFTLTELAIVLGIMGLILGSIWVAVGQVSANNKATKATGQTMQILNGYRSLYTQHGVDTAAGVWTDVTCIGVNAGFFEPDMLVTGTACATGTTSTYPLSPWGAGGRVTVTAYPDNNAIGVQYSGLTQTACLNYAIDVYASPDLIFQNINGTNQWLPPYAATTAWTMAQINGLCSLATGNTVQAAFKAR